MIRKTMIFISSAFEEDLKSPRQIIKNHLENCGYVVPLFEKGELGTWEKDTLAQCLEVVRECDVYILLINRKATANSNLLEGNVTPTYLEYQAAIQQKKHILVFVNSEILNNFMYMKEDFQNLYETYVNDYHRSPNSPFDPMETWIKEQMTTNSVYNKLLKVADPFVWAFLWEIFNNGHWFYEYDIARSEEQAKIVTDMLSTSFKSVVHLIPELHKIEEIRSSVDYFLAYADFTLDILKEKNKIKSRSHEDWSKVLEIGINFLSRKPIDIIQARNYNPRIVNTIQKCHAASLYSFNGKNSLELIGTAGNITAEEIYSLDEEDIFVVNAFNNKDRLITFNRDKQCLYVTEPIGDSVLCLHFKLDTYWTNENTKAYMDEIEYDIIMMNEWFFEFMKLVIGGRS